MSERNVLSDDRKKTLADCQGRQSGERLIEQSCCALVSGHEVGRVFWSEGSYQDRSPKESSEEARVDKMRLGPDVINLQTEELYCNYSVLIESPE